MKTIGKYEILGLLGAGGMGRVYKVRLPVAGRIVALKLLAPREELEMLLGMEELEARFLDEVRALGALRDPHVAQVLDFDRDAAGRPFFVMEYCCMNLGGLLGEANESEGPTRVLPVEAAARYAGQLLLALAHLHHAGLVHRDVKPFNLLVTAEDRIKLIDFGLSRGAQGLRSQPRGLKIGTPCYAAPEQEDEPDAADARADLFSAGVILWRMLTGQAPPEAGLRSGTLPAPSALPHMAGILDDQWDAFLLRAVHPDPGQRFQSARQMLQALQQTRDGWRQRLRAVCTLEEPAQAPDCPVTAGQPPVQPRSTPRKVRPAQAGQAFAVDDLRQPRCHYPAEFQDADPTGETLLHPATGLVWQRQGSDYPLEWGEAREYLARLNEQRLGGRHGWRLPTVDELLSILAPVRRLGDYCRPASFGPQRWLWSADQRSFGAAWYVDAQLGFAGSQDTTCPFHVRAVCVPCGESND